jgi:hypothetical protein
MINANVHIAPSKIELLLAMAKKGGIKIASFNRFSTSFFGVVS